MLWLLLFEDDSQVGLGAVAVGVEHSQLLACGVFDGHHDRRVAFEVGADDAAGVFECHRHLSLLESFDAELFHFSCPFRIFRIYYLYLHFVLVLLRCKYKHLIRITDKKFIFFSKK